MLEPVIQFTWNRREAKTVMAVLDVWVGLALFVDPGALERLVEQAGARHGYSAEQLRKSKEMTRKAAAFLASGKTFEQSPLALVEKVHRNLGEHLSEAGQGD